MITPDGIQQARKHLNHLKSLIAERNSYLSQYWNDVENYVKNSNVDEYEKNQALEGYSGQKLHLDSLFSELDKSQLGFVNEVLAILVICEENMGQLTVVNNEFLLPNQDVIDVFNTHLKNALAYAQKSEDVAQMLQNYSQEKMAENKKRLDKM